MSQYFCLKFFKAVIHIIDVPMNQNMWAVLGFNWRNTNSFIFFLFIVSNANELENNNIFNGKPCAVRTAFACIG